MKHCRNEKDALTIRKVSLIDSDTNSNYKLNKSKNCPMPAPEKTLVLLLNVEYPDEDEQQILKKARDDNGENRS